MRGGRLVFVCGQSQPLTPEQQMIEDEHDRQMAIKKAIREKQEDWEDKKYALQIGAIVGVCIFLIGLVNAIRW